MKAREAIEALRRRAAALLEPSRVEKTPRSALLELAESLNSTSDPSTKPRLELLERVRSAFVSAAAKDAWEDIPPRFWSHAPWTFWLGSPAVATLHSQVLPRYGEFLGSDKRGRSLRRLIDAWMDAYRPGLSGSGEAAALIRWMISRGDTPVAEDWASAEHELKMFDAEGGARRVGHAMATSRSEAMRILDLARISDEARRTGGFGRAAFEAFIGRIESDLASQAISEGRLSELLEFLEQSTTWRASALVATGLLKPWLDRAPRAPTIRERIYEYLIRNFGDPRLPGNTRWQGVDRDAEDIFRRWLAAATLREFFEVISDRADEQQWRYRNAFWTAVLEANLIEDAWVLLGRDVQAETRSRFGSAIACGRLLGYTSRQSVILMRVGSLVVAEVSHSGSLRIWNEEDPGAPRLGVVQASREQLIAPCLAFGTSNDPYGLRHVGSAEGNWQGHAARLIREQTGARLDRARYMPRQ
jgi:hypothetical protein